MDSPPSRRPGWIRHGAGLLLGLLVAGAVATAIAAAQYPGGTWMDRRTQGHSFWGNFLCDVARTPALDGHAHPGAPWGRAAEWALALALCVFFWIAPTLVEPPRRRRTIQLLGVVAALGLALVPVTERVAHALALLAGAGPGFTATVLLVRGLRPRPVLALLGALALGLAVLELGLYLGFREGFRGAPLPPAVPAVQRLALLAAVAWMGACALAVLTAGPDVGTARASSTGSPRRTYTAAARPYLGSGRGIHQSACNQSRRDNRAQRPHRQAEAADQQLAHEEGRQGTEQEAVHGVLPAPRRVGGARVRRIASGAPPAASGLSRTYSVAGCAGCTTHLGARSLGR